MTQMGMYLLSSCGDMEINGAIGSVISLEGIDIMYTTTLYAHRSKSDPWSINPKLVEQSDVKRLSFIGKVMSRLG